MLISRAAGRAASCPPSASSSLQKLPLAASRRCHTLSPGTAAPSVGSVRGYKGLAPCPTWNGSEAPSQFRIPHGLSPALQTALQPNTSLRPLLRLSLPLSKSTPRYTCCMLNSIPGSASQRSLPAIKERVWQIEAAQ